MNGVGGPCVYSGAARVWCGEFRRDGKVLFMSCPKKLFRANRSAAITSDLGKANGVLDDQPSRPRSGLAEGFPVARRNRPPVGATAPRAVAAPPRVKTAPAPAAAQAAGAL